MKIYQNVSLLMGKCFTYVSPELKMFHLQILKMRTISLKFFLKPLKHGRYAFSVNLRIIYDRKKAEIASGIRCDKKEWNTQKERFNHNIIFNQRLADLETKVYKAHHELLELGKEFGPQEIKEFIGAVKKPRIKLLSFYLNYLEDQKEKGQVVKSTQAKYKQTFDCLINYFNSSDREPAVKDIDFHFITKWDDYLKHTPYNNNGDMLQLNSVNKHHSRLKAVLNEAIRRQILSFNPYANFKLRYPQANREYLTQQEIHQLCDVNLANHPTASQVRDIFLFSCYTGLRYSDAMALNMENIQKIGNELYLRIDQIKTGERREIPLLGSALSIIEKYSWCNERMIENKVLPKLSNPKVNEYLKFIAEKAQIKKHLTHHVARHTCATTILLDNEVPIETVSHWLGHNSLRTTQIYAKISHSNLSKELRRLNNLV